MVSKKLGNGIRPFFMKDTTVYSNGQRSLPRNPVGCTILSSWVFDKFILLDELFAKYLRSFETCVLVNNNLCEELVSLLELQITFDERFKITSVRFFFSVFNLLSCELDNVTFKVLYWDVLYWCYIKAK